MRAGHRACARIWHRALKPDASVQVEGHGCVNRKLSAAQVRSIFKSRESSAAVARQFKISQPLVYLIRSRRIHQHLTERLQEPTRSTRGSKSKVKGNTPAFSGQASNQLAQAEARAQELQRPPHPLELMRVGVAPDHDRRALADPAIALAQHDALDLGERHELFQGAVQL
jgi:hypothetical protein